MFAISFSEAVKLKSYVWEHFKVNLHIHDTCGGGLFFSLDELDGQVSEFVLAYFEARGTIAELSKDGKNIFVGKSDQKELGRLSFEYEEANHRTVAYNEADECVGECTYVEKDGSWIVEHTFVAEAYRNQKIARALVLLLFEESKNAGVKIIPQCFYAKRVIQPLL